MLVMANCAEKSETECEAKVLSSNVNTYLMRNYGWAPSSWCNKAYALYAGSEGLEEQRRDSVKYAGFRDWDMHDQERAKKDLREQLSKANVDLKLLLTSIQHYTLMSSACVSQRVGHRTTITEEILNTCMFKNQPRLNLVNVEVPDKDNSLSLIMNDVDLNDDTFEDISTTDLSLMDRLQYMSGYKTSVDIIFAKLEAEGKLFFEQNDACLLGINEEFFHAFHQELKASTKIDFETNLIKNRVSALQEILDTGRVVSLPESTPASDDGIKIQIPLFDTRRNFKQNFFVQVPSKTYHALMHYFETEEDDDACQKWMDLTKILHCDSWQCQATEIYHFYSLWSNKNNPMRMYFEAKSAKMQREIRQILSTHHGAIVLDSHHDDYDLEKIVDNIAVLKTMWLFFKQARSTGDFFAHGRDGEVAVVNGEDEMMQTFKEKEWYNIQKLCSVLVLANRVEHLPSGPQDYDASQNLSLLMRFLYGELSIFNEIIRVNDILQKQEVDFDEQTRISAIQQEFPWFVIQKILQTRQASMMSEKLVGASTSLLVLDTDLGAFLVCVGLASFFYWLLGRPFQGVIEYFLKELLGLNFTLIKTVVEIGKEAAIAMIRRKSAVAIENAQNAQNSGPLSVQDTRDSDVLAIEDAEASDTPPVDDAEASVTLDSYLQTLRERLEIKLDQTKMSTDFAYEFIANDELLKTYLGTELLLGDVGMLDSLVEKIVRVIKTENLQNDLKKQLKNLRQKDQLLRETTEKEIDDGSIFAKFVQESPRFDGSEEFNESVQSVITSIRAERRDEMVGKLEQVISVLYQNLKMRSLATEELKQEMQKNKLKIDEIKTGLVNTTDETIIKKKKKTLGTLKVYREDLQRLIDLQEQRDELIKMV
tara:strand:+ start:1199 stop:3826 length:2628 start_codon:yes stop_codon:yes gene_type:complete